MPQQTKTLLPRAIHLADLNGDAEMELIFRNNQQIGYVQYEKKLTFFSSIYLPGKFGKNIRFADVDFDGDTDIISTETKDNMVRLVYLKNDGRGEFVDKIAIDSFTCSEQSLSTVYFYLLDQDKHNHIVAHTSDGLTFYRNNAKGGFIKKILNVKGYHRSTIIDLNEDGKEDLVSLSSGKISTLVQQDSVTFQEEIKDISDYKFSLNKIFKTDLDKDQTPDFIFETSDNIILWSKNTDFSSFKQLIKTEDHINDMMLFDYDNDGDLLTIEGNFSEQLKLYKNTEGTITRSLHLGSTESFQSVIPFDTDSDGDLDILYCSDWGEIGYIENLWID